MNAVVAWILKCIVLVRVLFKNQSFYKKKIDHDKYIFLHVQMGTCAYKLWKESLFNSSQSYIKNKASFFQNTQKKKKYECMINCIHLGHVCHLVYANNFYILYWSQTSLSHGGCMWLWSGSYGNWIYNYLCNQVPITTIHVSSIHSQVRCIRYNIIW